MLLSIILFLLLIASYYFCRSHYMIYYMKYIFPIYKSTIGRVFDLIPYSIFQWLVLLLIIFLVYLLIKKIKWVIPYLLSIALIYQCTCGMIYQRKDIKISNKEITPEQIEALALLIQDELDHLEYQPLTLEEIIQYAPKVMDHHESGYYPHPKKVLFSSFMSKTGITGIYSPFTLEANINIDVPLHTIPFTACHELSHLNGYMKEEQAQFNAYQACVESGIPYFEYSAYQLVLSQIARYSTHTFTVPDFFYEDYQKNISYWKEKEGPLSEIEDQINDTYLQMNGDQGIISYSQMIYDLIDYYQL